MTDTHKPLKLLSLRIDGKYTKIPTCSAEFEGYDNTVKVQLPPHITAEIVNLCRGVIIDAVQQALAGAAAAIAEEGKMKQVEDARTEDEATPAPISTYDDSPF